MACGLTSKWILLLISFYLSTAEAQRWGGDDDGNDKPSRRPPWWDGAASGTNPYDFADERFGYYSSDSGRRVLIAHAVTASAVWVILVPLGGILLRLNIRSPWVLRVHAGLQIMSYLLYIAAMGMGIYLIQTMTFGGYTTLWRSSHPRLGMAIFGLATFQPILGAIHHKMFKKRVENVKAGKPGPVPGRTIPGQMHLWLGRVLIVLGIVNGGLGINLASQTPFQSDNSTRTAAIIYGVIAAIMFLAYVVIVVVFEKNKVRRDRELQTRDPASTTTEDVPPTYAESQESLQKPEAGVTRYG